MRALCLFSVLSLLLFSAGCSSCGSPCGSPCDPCGGGGGPIPCEYSDPPGDTDTPPTCCGLTNCGHCLPGNKVGICGTVPWVETMKHGPALDRLREAGFIHICCDGSEDHQNCNPSAVVYWQHCESPGTLDMEDIVYLCFDPRHAPHQ